MIHGWLPYANIAIAHTPLMLLKLAIFYKIFGVGILQLKIFTWAVILVLDFLVFFIAKKLWNTKTALIALGSFVVWQLFFDGNGLWFDLFLGIPVLVSYFFVQKRNYFWVGIFWALAFISKQTAIWFLVPIGFSLITDYRLKIKDILQRPLKGDPYKVALKFISGVLIVLAIFVLSLFTFHLLPSFWNWAVHFGIFILPKAEGQIQLPDLKALAVSTFPFLILIPLIWKDFRKNINLLVWAVAGSLGAYPRFEYFHFQPAIPFLAIASGIFFSSNFPKQKLIKTFTILYVLGSLYLFSEFFMRNWKEGVRFYESDVQDVVSYVKYSMKSGDKIFVMNWWDNIYALSDTLPAVNPWVPQLSWYMEIPGIQEKMVTELETSKPKLILLSSYSETGLSAYVPQKVFDYISANYKLKQKVDGIEILTPK
jgi:hypothetical protein